MTRLLSRTVSKCGAIVAALIAGPALPVAHAQAEPDLRSRYTVVGDGIPKPLAPDAPNVENGRRIVTERQTGLCVLCHSGPFPEARFQGDIATNLAGTGSRWSEAQLRLRLVDASQLNPQTIMPSYYRTQGLERVGWQWRGQPVLNAQQIEDVVAFLKTLKD
ncbi:MAG TPA: sulfur oxidation c-type cytochrome SoxX [Burkholderiaceae bacterium]|nr:sulfur oxidation c-type cytochrome SoxX [Burkholderiaceae bacterium]